MENASELAIPAGKLYSDQAIIVGTFFGGPLAAGYLLAENFTNLDQDQNARTTWIVSIFLSVMIFAAILFVPQIEKMPGIAFPLLYTFTTRAIVNQYQKAYIQSHIETGGKMYSMWRAMLAGTICLLISLAILIPASMIVD